EDEAVLTRGHLARQQGRERGAYSAVEEERLVDVRHDLPAPCVVRQRRVEALQLSDRELDEGVRVLERSRGGRVDCGFGHLFLPPVHSSVPRRKAPVSRSPSI